MMEQIKKLLIVKTQQELMENDSVDTEIRNIEERIEILKSQNEIIEQKTSNFFEQSKVKRRLRNYNFFEKYFSKRKSYMEDLNKIKNYDEVDINKLEMEYKKKKEEIEILEGKRDKLISLRPNLEDIKEKINIIENAKTLKDLNMSLTEILKLLKDNGMLFVLTEDDKKIKNNSSNLFEPKNLVLIHKTKYSPKNNKVLSRYLNGGKGKITIPLPEDDFCFEYPYTMNTIHFCINGEVVSHMYGNFDKRKYAVIIPFQSVSKKNLCSLREEDTFFDGVVDISNGYILCPNDEVTRISKENPNVNVIGYEGEFVDGYAEAFIRLMGYQSNWIDPIIHEQPEYISHIIKNIHSDCNTISHEHSYEQKRDDLLQEYYSIIAFIEALIAYNNKKSNLSNNLNYYDLLYNLYNSEDIHIISVSNFSYNSIIFEKHSPLKKGFDKVITGETTENYDLGVNGTSLSFFIKQLYKEYGIKMSQSMIKLLKNPEYSSCLIEDYPYHKAYIEKFCFENIEEENLKNLFLKLIENKKIIRISQMLDFIFLVEITKQVLEKKEIKTISK